jgi:hypothetical protein
MPIAFGNELNSSIMVRFSILGEESTARWFLESGACRTRQKSSAAEREHVTHRVLENMA